MALAAVTDNGKTTGSNVRWVICALLFWVTTSNYIDRGVFGNLAPEMPKYLHLAEKIQPEEIDRYWNANSKEVIAVHARHSHPEAEARTCDECKAFVKAQIVKKSWDESYWNMGVFFSAAYAISMLLMGRMMDVIGLRWGFVIACSFWTLASMLHADRPSIAVDLYCP